MWCVLWLIDCDWEKLVIWRTVNDQYMMVVGWPCVVDRMLKSKNWLTLCGWLDVKIQELTKFLRTVWPSWLSEGFYPAVGCLAQPQDTVSCLLLLFLRWQALVFAQIQLNFARTLYIARLCYIGILLLDIDCGDLVTGS